MRQISVLSVLLFALSSSVSAQNEYCRFSSKHSLCNNGIGAKCGTKVPKRGLSESDKKVILDQHNALRQRVANGLESRGAPGPQPSASNMRQMEWDDELAAVAQAHADQCIFEHECSRCRKVSRFGVGQNLFISFQSNFDMRVEWTRAVDAWYDEVRDVDPATIDPFQFSAAVGHYTQMMWWSTWKVGCGYTMFREGGWWKKLYTCDYGPGGNVIFTEMYRKGSPCSACPTGTTCSTQHPGLCVPTDSSQANIGSSSSSTSSPAVGSSAGRRLVQMNSRPEENNNRLQQIATIQPQTLRPLQTTVGSLPTLSLEPAFRPQGFNLGLIEHAEREEELEQETESEFEASEHETEFFEQEVDEQTHFEEEMLIPFNGPTPTIQDLAPFIDNQQNTQVIQTNSFASVQSLLQNLPAGQKPIVLFRTGSGQLTQVDLSTLRQGRSTTTTTTLSPATALLMCDWSVSPCMVNPVGNPWQESSDANQGTFIETNLSRGEKSKLFVQKVIAAPKNTNSVCVSLTYRRGAAGSSASESDNLLVGLWPLGSRKVIEAEVRGKPGVWNTWHKTFTSISSSFMTLLEVVPPASSASESLAVSAFMITPGACPSN